jgi:hypothetical protein
MAASANLPQTESLMTAEQAHEAAKGLTFEDVWAALMKTDAQIEKMSKRVDQTSEVVKKTSEVVKKTSEEVAELSKNIGGVNRSLGRWTEQMVAAKLWEKFDVFEYEFTKGSRNIKFRDGGQTIAEVDIFLENGDYAMPVEVKTDLTEEDIDDHLDRIGKIRVYMDKHGDKRRLVGAVAGAIVPESVCRYAQKKGLYVLVQSGDSIEVASVPKGFQARKW